MCLSTADTQCHSQITLPRQWVKRWKIVLIAEWTQQQHLCTAVVCLRAVVMRTTEAESRIIILPVAVCPHPVFRPLILPCRVLMSGQLQRGCSGRSLKVHVWKHVHMQQHVKSEFMLSWSLSQKASVSAQIYLLRVCVFVCGCHKHDLVAMVTVFISQCIKETKSTFIVLSSSLSKY